MPYYELIQAKQTLPTCMSWNAWKTACLKNMLWVL